MGRGRVALTALATVLAAATLAAAPASAAHHFCPSGGGPQQCERSAGVATDAETGLVYIADEGADRVQVFDEGGGFVRTIGAGVLDTPRGVSVDNDPASATRHDVFVIDAQSRVLRFTPAGELRLGIGWGVADDSAEAQTCGPEGAPPAVFCLTGIEGKGTCQLGDRSQIAAGPGGRVFVSDSAGKEVEVGFSGFKNRVMKFAPDGASCEEEPVFPEGSKKTLNAIAVDPAGGVYLAVVREGVEIRKLAPGGSVVCSIDPGVFSTALAVDPATDRLYAGQGEAKVRVGGFYETITIYEPGCAGETVGTVRRFAYAQIETGVRGLAVLPGALAPAHAGDPVLSEGGFGLPFITFHLEAPPPGPIAVPGSAIADPVSNTKATLGAEINPEGKETKVSIEFVEKAICEADEAGGGECFEEAESSAPITLAQKGFVVQGAETLFGCNDPLSEAGHPGENAYEAGECLEPETAYRFRVKASNVDGQGNSPLDGGTVQTRPWLEFGPAWASSVGTGSARLNAQVNPLGVPVSARFEVVTHASFEASGFAEAFEVPSPAEAALDFGAGETPTARGIVLGGLDPGTAYRYRLVAGNPLIEPVAGDVRRFTTFASPGSLECPANEAFRTGPGALLPDCRGYEMVSPLDKEQGDIITLGSTLTNTPAVLTQSSLDGSRLAYGSLKAFGDAPSAPWTSQYLAQRHERGQSEEGWKGHAISSPIDRPLYSPVDQTETEVKALSPDLCSAWIEGIAEPTLAEGAQVGYPNLYRRSDEECGGPAYEALSTAKWKESKAQAGPHDLEVQGVSADGEIAAFLAPDGLAGTGSVDITGKKPQLYVWAGGPRPVFACILPDGTALAESCSAGRGAGGVSGLGRLPRLQGALSADGHRLFWTAGEGDGKIYMREGAGQGKTAGECTVTGRPCTVAVSVQGETISGTGKSHFRAAATDGSKEVFTTNSAGSSGEDLYLAKIGEEAGHPVLTGTDPIAGDVIGVMGMSENASHVYFASREAIAAAGPDGLGAEAKAGEPNLYLYREGTYAFIGTFSAQDVDPALRGPVAAAPVDNLARVAADGEHAAFLSSAPLTGYDNADVVSGEPDTEVFLYDAGTKKLLCASCNPSEARPAGRRNAGKDQVMSFAPPWISAWFEGHQTSLYASRALAADGKRLFFNSTDSLVARDTNGRADVYQWEAPGAGSCKTTSSAYSPADGGCIDLISSGQSAQDSEFLDASPTGSDVFFTTLSNLVPADFDLVDVYDARVDGGFPPPSPPPVECEGEACQSPPPAPPPPAPASSGYPRSDNAVADRCAALAKRERRVRRANPARARRLAKQVGRCRRAERRRAAG